MKNLSRDLKSQNPEATCFSPTNLLYMKNFYLLYQPYLEDSSIAPQLVEQFAKDIFSMPWGHHRLLIDKFQNQAQKTFVFVRQTLLNGWSRDMLLNYVSTDLYERQGKALTKFKNTLPEETSELAQELTKDPYNFAFTGITGRYNERKLKDALLNNITDFLLELGTGFAYVGGQGIPLADWRKRKVH